MTVVEAAIAAGHPATAAAGAEILAAGGNAADAAVAASLASCVAESVMTGLLGGGHAIYHDAATGQTRNLDCFVAIPGLGGDRPDAEVVELRVPFGSELVHYSVGPATCGVPGVVAGLGALHDAYGALAWPRLVEPALRLAVEGVPMPRAHASCLEMLAVVMTMNEGARIYSPSGSLLAEGELLQQPGLVDALSALADEGPASFYTGTVAGALLELMEERRGLVTAQDLEAYEPLWSDSLAFSSRGHELRTRDSLGDFAGTLERLDPAQVTDDASRVVATARVLGQTAPADPGTTNLAVRDRDGNACVLTTSLGLGSGDFVPRFDLHLNSMLGETDLLTGTPAPGERMASMMAPTIALAAGEVVLAVGAAGGTRLRSALLQVVSGILDEELPAQAAIERPRLHPVGTTVHLEPGFAESSVAALEAAGFEPRVWPARHHYFGGVSAVTPTGGAADPRRSGDAQVLP